MYFAEGCSRAAEFLREAGPFPCKTGVGFPVTRYKRDTERYNKIQGQRYRNLVSLRDTRQMRYNPIKTEIQNEKNCISLYSSHRSCETAIPIVSLCISLYLYRVLYLYVSVLYLYVEVVKPLILYLSEIQKRVSIGQRRRHETAKEKGNSTFFFWFVSLRDTVYL